MTTPESPRRPARVIVIDDDDLMRGVIRAAVEALDCEIVGEAADGNAGLELFKDTQPDLVLLDIRMPEMDGIMALEAITKADGNAYVVMLTSMEDEGFVEDAMIGGAKDYLRKNMSVNEMVARLERHLERLSPEA